jgi:flagellar hook-length control protein FliK
MAIEPHGAPQIMITLQNLPKTSGGAPVAANASKPAAANASKPAAADASAPAADDAASALPGFASLLADRKANAGSAPDTTGTASSNDDDTPAPAVADAATGEVQAAIAMVASIAAAPAHRVAAQAPAEAAELQPRAVGRQSEVIKPAAPMRAEPPGTAGTQERTRARAIAPEAGLASRGMTEDAASGAAPNPAVARELAALTGSVHSAEQPLPAPGTPVPQLAAFALRYPTEPASPPASVDAPIGSARWGEQLATQVVVLVRDGTQAADIHVTPPELGPVRARITIDDGVATVMLSAPAHATREALEAALPALRDVLAESGIQLGGSAVSEERFAQQREARPDPLDRDAALTRASATDLPDGAPRERRVRVGLLDLYA